MARQKPSTRVTPVSAEAPSGWIVKLQILAGVFVPMLLLGVWLRTRGFW